MHGDKGHSTRRPSLQNSPSGSTNRSAASRRWKRPTQRRASGWLLDQKEYQEWLNSDPRDPCAFLWIKGKPGVGKSTIMKFALARTRKALPPSYSDSLLVKIFGGALALSQAPRAWNQWSGVLTPREPFLSYLNGAYLLYFHFQNTRHFATALPLLASSMTRSARRSTLLLQCQRYRA